MPDNYASSALRHLEDATSLIAAGRTDNAGYLAGYVIECSLKALLEYHGHAARAYGHDLPALRGKALILAGMLSPGASRYSLVQGLPEATSTWKTELRYHTTGTLTAEASGALVEAAHHVYEGIVVSMIIDGHLADWR